MGHIVDAYNQMIHCRNQMPMGALVGLLLSLLSTPTPQHPVW